MRRICLLLLIAACFFQCTLHKARNTGILVLYNSHSSEFLKTEHRVIPYLDHFGCLYKTLDIAQKKLPDRLDDFSLVIIGHDHFIDDGHLRAHIDRLIEKAIVAHTGLVTFDPAYPVSMSDAESLDSVEVKALVFSTSAHYIIADHAPADTLPLFGAMNLPGKQADDCLILIGWNDHPLLAVSQDEGRKVVHWMSQEWMLTSVLGPLGGLDDCLWRSIVWAARKPFVMHCLPPIVTMRVDDVAGRGMLWNQSPLYWVKTANQYGFKPWLGLFVFNLSPEAVNELQGYLLDNMATATPHALGRPPRSDLPGFKTDYLTEWDNNFYRGFYYYTDALPLRETVYDEFLYFDHQHGTKWPDQEAVKGLEAVSAWYQKNAPLPMSSYFVPHWYEAGSNTIAYVARNWNMEFCALPKNPDVPYNDSTQWLQAGPFRLYEPPGTCTNNPALRGQRPVYYADFIAVEEEKFFDCMTEIRDDAGYEWAPNNDVPATIGRGVRQLKRALNSLAMAVLFTHETDFIYKIKPENWDEELKAIADSVDEYQPLYPTMDQALKIVRAYRTADLYANLYQPQKNILISRFHGSTDIETFLTVFIEENSRIRRIMASVPVFKRKIEITVKL